MRRLVFTAMRRNFPCGPARTVATVPHAAVRRPRRTLVWPVLGAATAILGGGYYAYRCTTDPLSTFTFPNLPVAHAHSEVATNRDLCLLVLHNDERGVRDYLATHATASLDPALPDSPSDEAMDKRRRRYLVNCRHPLGWTPLLVACANGHAAMVALLLAEGADSNLPDKFQPADVRSYHVLRDLYLTREREFCSLFYPSAPTAGFTPLHYACVQGNTAVIKQLLDAGADPRVQDQNGHLCRDYLDADLPGHAATLRGLAEAENHLVAERKRRAKALRQRYPLEQQLQEMIVGQLTPINAVASAIRRRENGWHDEDRPLVFLFLGSSGVGKTELAKQVARYLHHNDAAAFIRVDLSEFQSKHEVAKFIGSPPGYVGYEEGGQLTEKLAKCPNAVVLLDEVEKAHPDVLTIMLQVFDEGHLTDGKGQTVDCKDAIFILTSNLAQHEIADEAEALRAEAREQAPTAGLNDEATSLSRRFVNTTVYPILRGHFRRDEFLGRINEILFFLPFNTAELRRITTKELERWARKAEARHQIRLTWTPAVVEELAEGYNVRYGARSIKHEVEKRVVNQIAKAHELDELSEGDAVHLYTEDGTVRLKLSRAQQESKASRGGFFT
ncbi:hypothetical protein IWQ60_010186 [Tieghemiomyces parasiticus]|uniref:Uncharacterized protein n=1 Tax=Tieghemiomyces parasiticus TaxID=78921 RepID=A0A9W8DIS4_9FUNG|nr:hypothetical protein IWQ60_010186 [Tieghemiomyces parasiticus]